MSPAFDPLHALPGSWDKEFQNVGVAEPIRISPPKAVVCLIGIKFLRIDRLIDLPTWHTKGRLGF
jgi:hypothetical protein